ncbi:MAG: hypothetical protein ACE5DS_00780 [Kiloniellaceae bacterium]
MTLSKRAVETLLDLVEIKLSCIEVHDREDTRELASLEQCRSELQRIMATGETAAAFVKPARGRGRQRATA